MPELFNPTEVLEVAGPGSEHGGSTLLALRALGDLLTSIFSAPLPEEVLG